MSESLQSLDDVLNGVPEPEAPAEETPTAEPEPVATQEEVKEEEAPAAPEAKPEEENWTKTAVLDERRKQIGRAHV